MAQEGAQARRTARILVAIPCLNEGSTIGSMVLKARKHADEVAELAGAHVVRHEANRGYGAALRSCFLFARENPADFMVILDGDGQHNPAENPIVLDPVVRGRADVSVGSRFLAGKKGKGVPAYRRLGIGVLGSESDTFRPFWDRGLANALTTNT